MKLTIKALAAALALLVASPAAAAELPQEFLGEWCDVTSQMKLNRFVRAHPRGEVKIYRRRASCERREAMRVRADGFDSNGRRSCQVMKIDSYRQTGLRHYHVTFRCNDLNVPATYLMWMLRNWLVIQAD